MLLVAIAAAGLGAGYALKAQCNNRDWDGIQFRRSCYSDVVPLYFARRLNEKRFPYLHSTPQTRAAQPPEDLEYPAGTGLYVGIVAENTSTVTGFFNANAVGLALMGIAAAVALAAMVIDWRRVLLYAIGPSLILYAFHNWDLLAVGAMTLAFLAYHRRADGWAGLLLGVGAATKLFPAFVLPALLIGAWKRERKLPWGMAATFVAALAAINLPIMFANYGGWKYPWSFQGARTANFETSWFMLFHDAGGRWFFDSSLVNLISGALFVVGAGVLLMIQMIRKEARVYATSFAILVWFLCTAKVFSPQYALWLLPFFALLEMPWWSYVAFAITDAAVWFSVSAYFLAIQYHGGDPNLRLDILQITVWGRYVALLALIALSLVVRENVRQVEPVAEPAPVPLTA